jgi:transposase-like protein
MTDLITIEDFPKNEAEFDEHFSTEQACYEYLFKKRWPQGFICRRCEHREYWKSSRGLYICCNCEHQHSLTAGTILHSSKKPLRHWFKAMWWFTTRKSGINAVTLQQLLGFRSYGTAWSWLHKLRSCTVCTERKKLSGTVEVDEFYLGGQHPGKRGRGAEHKSVIVAATEKKGRKLGRIRLQVLDDCSSDSIDPFMLKNIDQKSLVITDGWSSYTPVENKGYHHQRVLQTKAEDKSSVLPGINLIASLFKRLVMGTFHGRCDRKHLQHYLNEYVFRFNRRTTKYVGKRFMRICEQAMGTAPKTYRMIINATPASPQLLLENYG